MSVDASVSVSGESDRSADIAAQLVAVTGREPLNAQVAIAEALHATGRVLAVVPTGGGKTLAAVAPFAAGLTPVRQMLFLAPLTTLVDQQARVVAQEISAPAASARLGLSWTVRTQSGIRPEDPLFEAPAVVATFDQALSAACHIAYATSRRRRRIDAGAVLTAYLACDEIHLYPRDEALTTLLWLLRDRPPLPFCLMTATLSTSLGGELARLLDAQLIADLGAADRERLGIAERTRALRWNSEPLAADDVVAAVASGRQRVLVVVNTVARCIELGRELLSKLHGRADVTILHSRFYAADRDRQTRRALEVLGKGPPRHGPAVVVTTQVIEAGVDISADLVLSELAPANALIQRAGRCARWGGSGEIVVAPPQNRSPAPYSSQAERPILNCTADWLTREAGGAGVSLDAATERTFLDAAHRASDEAWIEALAERLTTRRGRVGQVAEAGDMVAAGELIRQVNDRTVLVHGEPERLADPTVCAGFSLPVGVLGRLLKDDRGAELGEEDWLSLDVPGEGAWRVKRPVWPDGGGTEPAERLAGKVARWESVTTMADLRAERLLAVQPAIVAYSPEFGLELRPGPAGPEFWAAPARRQVPKATGGRRGETLEQHVHRMLVILAGSEPLGPRVDASRWVVDAWLGWPSGLLLRLVRIAVILHDAGKLAPGWQAAAKAYERALGRAPLPFMVHTDPSAPGVAAPVWGAPPHALAGAAASVAVGAWLDEGARAGPTVRYGRASAQRVLFWTIATHHAPTVDRFLVPTEQRIGTGGRAEIARLLHQHEPAAPEPVQPDSSVSLVEYALSDAIEQPRAFREWVAYSVAVRALRLADGWSQEPERLAALGMR